MLINQALYNGEKPKVRKRFSKIDCHRHENTSHVHGLAELIL
jgi:hypothetical protein